MEQTVTGLTQVVEAWRSLIKMSEQNDKRKKFMQTAKMCSHFYAGAMGFMWDEQFRKDFLGNMPSPEFRITIAKAFEMVAIMVPNLMWDYPGRISKPVQRVKLPEKLFGDPERYQQYIDELETRQAEDEVACKLMDTYLNYAQREQPGGGLVQESHQAIIDAIVKGRGVLFTEPYRFPGSERTLTRSTYVDIANFYIDPDSCRANLTDAAWIAIRHKDAWYDVAAMFPHVDPEMLRKNAHTETVESVAVNSDPKDRTDREYGLTNDQVVWYEIFSKCGVGTRLKRVKSELHDAFEEVVGDYARICITEGIKYPLNFPPKLSTVADDDMAREAFDWVVPYYKDGRWPVSLLDFYQIPNNPWPIAPLAMALGELVFLNIMTSCLAERVYNTSRNIMLVNPALGEDIIAAIKSAKFSDIVESNNSLDIKLSEMIQFIQFPQIPQDAFAMKESIKGDFEERSGLSPLLYGGTPGNKVMRSAEDSRLKHDAANIRVEDMARKVERFQTDVANLDRICAGWAVKGEDLRELFGDDLCVELWNELIAGADPETYVRMMRTTLEAQSMKKPNKAKDADYLQQANQWLVPVMQMYMQLTGDVKPVNGLIRAFAESMDMDPEPWLLPERVPTEVEQQQQIAAAQQQPEQPQGPSPEDLQAQHEMEMQHASEQQQLAMNQQQMALEHQQALHDLKAQSAQANLSAQQQAAQIKAAQMMSDLQAKSVKLEQAKQSLELQKQKAKEQARQAKARAVKKKNSD